jgi:hypothetical protein
MNKVIIATLLLVLIGGVVGMKLSGGSKKTEAPVRKAYGVKIKDGEILIDVKGKFSMVDLKIKLTGGKMGGFESNKELFNSELLNRIEEDGSVHVVLGILKPTAELPSGEVSVGKMTDTVGGQLEVGGKVTVPSDGNDAPKEIEVYSGGVSSK